MGIGKWILTGLGWTMMGPVGAIIGYLVGKKLENKTDDMGGQRINSGNYNSSSSNQKWSHWRYQNTGNDADLSAALLVLIAAVMNADSVVKKSELDMVKRFLLSKFMLHLSVVCSCLYMSCINKHCCRINKFEAVTVFKNTLEYLLKEIGIFKSSCIVLSKC